MFNIYATNRATGKTTRANLQAALLLSEGNDVVLLVRDTATAQRTAQAIACLLPMATCKVNESTIALNDNTVRVVGLQGLAHMTRPGQRPVEATLLVDI
jgi:hypothetical protein